jgi:branched-subunit amino acid aminotransferase/4-amino-4-deoxychorismate lyase
VVGAEQDLINREFHSCCNFSGTVMDFHDVQAVSLYRLWALGDGIFETIRVWKGIALNTELHFHRFQKGLTALKLSSKIETVTDFTREINKVIAANKIHSGTIRITAWRKGYGAYRPSQSDSEFLLISKPLPEELFPIQKPVNAITKHFDAERWGMPVPGIKTASSLPWILAAMEEEGLTLYLNADGNIWEAGIYSPLCYLENSGWTLPQSKPEALDGTMRIHLIQMLQNKGEKICQRVVNQNELHDLRHLYFCNAIKGLVPVSSLDEKELAIYKL